MFLCIAVMALLLSGQIVASQRVPGLVAYVNTISQWWPSTAIAGGLGVPGYAIENIYNEFLLAFWSCQLGPLDVVLIWTDPLFYFSSDNPFGKTNDQIQKELRRLYNAAGKKIMVSAFGATEFPTSQGLDAEKCGRDFGKFVVDNNFDGADADYEDNGAMEAGTGLAWLIKFNNALKSVIGTLPIAHAPQGPYFKSEFYRKKSYVELDQAVGKDIEQYLIQFYNQGDTKYDTYETLFVSSGGYFSGTSIGEIIARGIQKDKLVVGKPATLADVMNTGYMDSVLLGQAVIKGHQVFDWCGGVMFWQYSNDIDGKIVSNAGRKLL